MIKLKTIFQEYSDCAFPILAASKRELTHDAKVAHALMEVISLIGDDEQRWLYEDAEQILREKYGVTE